MPKLFSDLVIDECRKDYLSGMTCLEIAKKHGIKRQGTVKGWSKRYEWDKERQVVRLEAAKKCHQELVDEKAKVCGEHARIAKKFLIAIESHFKVIETPDGQKRLKKISAKSLVSLAGAFDRVVRDQRLALGMDDESPDKDDHVAIQYDAAGWEKMIEEAAGGSGGGGNGGANGNGAGSGNGNGNGNGAGLPNVGTPAHVPTNGNGSNGNGNGAAPSNGNGNGNGHPPPHPPPGDGHAASGGHGGNGAGKLG